MQQKLLIVDDDPSLRECLDMTVQLLFEDIEVLTANSVEEAWEYTQSQDPDLYLIDTEIGQDKGYDLARRIGAAKQPIAVMGMSGDETYREHWDQAGFAFIPKSKLAKSLKGIVKDMQQEVKHYQSLLEQDVA